MHPPNNTSGEKESESGGLFGAVVILILIAIPAVMAYRDLSHQDVAIRSEIDTSVLLPQNPGCKITGPDGKPLDVFKVGTIPKGTMITGSCFAVKTN